MPNGYPSDWDARRRKVYQRDNYTCQNCGAKGGSQGNTELHAHHIVPKSKGGSHNISNLKTLCSHCHDAVHDGGIVSPKINFGSWRRHVFYLIFTLGVGNVLHLTNSLWKSYRQRRKVNKRLRRAKYGRLKIHLLLLFTTAGVGNIIYYLYKNPSNSMGVSGDISNQMAGSEDSYSNRNGSFNWDKKSKYPYDSYYEATDKIERLKREGRHDEVEDLLMWCINFAEAEAETKNQTLPRAYYRHLAIVYRKENRYHDEVKILERYILFCEKLGDQPREEITGRLDRAKELAAK